MIRPAAGADVAELTALWERYRAEAADTRCPDREIWRHWILPRISAGDVRVGMVDRRPVGYVAWQRRVAGPTLRILELYVHPDGRGERLGSGLLARAIDAARARNCEVVEIVANVHADAVQALALPFGFALEGDVLRLRLQRREPTPAAAGSSSTSSMPASA